MTHICAAYIFHVIEFCNFTAHFPHFRRQRCNIYQITRLEVRLKEYRKLRKKFRSREEKSYAIDAYNNQMNSENQSRLVAEFKFERTRTIVNLILRKLAGN